MNEKINEYSKKIDYLKNNEHIREKFYDSILYGQIEPGMNTLEAKLAGGAFFYRVIIDKEVWSDSANPLEVISRQVIKPDNSKIEMTFRNATQFPELENIKIFKIIIELGVVKHIIRIN